jgi:tetratricopeptide (TPR) repeat protein
VRNETGRSLGATFADLSGDGWPDLYVANDVSDNVLYVNRGDGSFEDQTAWAMVGDYRGAMGLAVGDVDGDLDLDFFVTHWVAQENALYTNLAEPGEDHGALPVSFRETSHRCGLGFPALALVGWATRFFDYDNDGSLDLFVVNGSTIPTDEDPTQLTPMRSHLYWNAGAERGFFELGAHVAEFFAEEHVGRGGATFDYDLDGDEDLLITLHGDRPRLLRNEGGNRKRTVRVRLRQPSGNRFALGAALRVEAGGRTLFDQVGTQGSYLSQHAVGELAFGLGDAPEVEALVVTWPDGTQERAGPVPVDCLVTWERGTAPAAELLPGKRPIALAGPADVDAQRRFFDVLREAGELRIAGEHARAAESYRAALAAWPTHEDALYNLGNCLLAMSRREEALGVYRRLVLFHPMCSRGWMQIGLVLLDPAARDLALAEQAFTRSHEINAEESLPLVRLGRVAFLRGQLERADELLADAGVLNARSVESRYLRGHIAWLRGHDTQAREFLSQAHQLARGSGAGESVSNEGDTRTGDALVAPATGADEERWTTLLERPVDPAVEYGERGS